MSNVIAQAVKGRFRIRIMQDEEPDDPRNWDNLGTMVCGHKRYRLGDEQAEKGEYENWEEWLEGEVLSLHNAFYLPLYLYDHGGITMRTRPFYDPWDSAQVGWIYVTLDRARGEFGDLSFEEMEQRVLGVLEGEVQEYDTYLRGDAYGFEIEEYKYCEHCKRSAWEPIDSCWGFLGGDFGENGMKEAVGEEHRELFELALEEMR